MSLLLIIPTDAAQRRCVGGEQPPSWGAGFDHVLHKHGFLNVDRRDTDFIVAAGIGVAADARPPLVIVPQLPRESWTVGLIDALAAHAGPLLVEGPLPEAAASRFGFPSAAAEGGPPTGVVLDGLRAGLAPPAVREAVIFKPAWEDYPNGIVRSPERLRGDILHRHCHTFLARLVGGRSIAPGDGLGPALIVTGLGLYRQPAGPTADQYRERLIRAAQRLDGPAARHPAAKWLAARAAGRRLTPAANAEDPWLKLVAALDGAPPDPAAVVALAGGARDWTQAVLAVWLAVASAAPAARAAAQACVLRLARAANLATVGDNPPDLPAADAVRLHLALLLLGEVAPARRLADQILEGPGVNTANGYVRMGHLKGGRWVREVGVRWMHCPWLALLLWHLGEPVADTARGSDGLDALWPASVLDAWRRPPAIPPALAAAGGAVVARALNDDGIEIGAAALQVGARVLLQVPLLSLSCFAHTVAPRPAAVRYLDCQSAIDGEEIILVLLHRLSAYRPLVRIRPWPDGARGCLTFRHDVDRLPDADLFADVLTWERNCGLGASWYWIGNRLQPDYIKAVEEVGLENGLHAVKIDDKPIEVAAVAALSGNPVAGECTHQGGGSDEWLGVQQLMAAQACGYIYAITQFSHAYPFRMLGLDATGVVGAVPGPLCLSYVGTVDKPGKSDEEMRKGFKADVAWYEKGYHTIISNHPDINIPWLKEIETLFPRDGRLNWNARQVAEWWSATHDPESLVVRLEGGRPKVVLPDAFQRRFGTAVAEVWCGANAG